MDQSGSDTQKREAGVNAGKEAPAAFIERCTAEMCGNLAWLRTDLLQKGAAQHADRVNTLCEHFDSICARLDAPAEAMGNASASGTGSSIRAADDLRAALESAEQLVSELVDGREVFTEERDRQLTERFEAIETALEEGERKGPVPGGER